MFIYKLKSSLNGIAISNLNKELEIAIPFSELFS